MNTTIKDGNDNIYPIAFVFIDGKEKSSWLWFLSKLKLAIETFVMFNVAIKLSHKSVFNAAKHVYPVSHMLYVTTTWLIT